MYIKRWLEKGCPFVKSPSLFRCKEGTLYYKASTDILKRFVFTTYVPTGSCVLYCAWSVVTRNSLTPIYQFVFHQQKWFCLFVMSWWLMKCEQYLCHQCRVFVIVKTLFLLISLDVFPEIYTRKMNYTKCEWKFHVISSNQKLNCLGDEDWVGYWTAEIERNGLFIGSNQKRCWVSMLCVFFSFQSYVLLCHFLPENVPSLKCIAEIRTVWSIKGDGS